MDWRNKPRIRIGVDESWIHCSHYHFKLAQQMKSKTIAITRYVFFFAKIFITRYVTSSHTLFIDMKHDKISLCDTHILIKWMKVLFNKTKVVDFFLISHMLHVPNRPSVWVISSYVIYQFSNHKCVFF